MPLKRRAFPGPLLADVHQRVGHDVGDVPVGQAVEAPLAGRFDRDQSRRAQRRELMGEGGLFDPRGPRELTRRARLVFGEEQEDLQAPRMREGPEEACRRV